MALLPAAARGFIGQLGAGQVQAGKNSCRMQQIVGADIRGFERKNEKETDGRARKESGWWDVIDMFVLL